MTCGGTRYDAGMVRMTLAIGLAIAACKGNDGARPAPAPIAAKPIDAGGRAPPPAVGDRTIRRDGVGPITTRTAVTVDALAPLFPDLEVVPSGDRGDVAEINDTPRIEIGDQLIVPSAKDATTIKRVEVIGATFATAAKVRVGMTVKELAAAEPTAACRLYLEDNLKALTCRVPGAPELVYTIEDGGFNGAAGPLAIADIARRAITQITWRAK